MSRIKEIRATLGKVRPKRRLGQTFMVDPNLLEAIVRDAGITADDTVLEIGTGMGALTKLLAREAAAVLTVEIDPRFVMIAGRKLSRVANVEIIHADFLAGGDRVSPEVEERLWKSAGEAELVVVGNLPYSASGPIVATLMQWHRAIKVGVFTIQKEMAQRLVAEPGTKPYGKLSVIVQTRTEVTLLRTIPATCFWPRPAVDSAVVRLEPTAPADESTHIIAWLAHGVFQHRRKTIRNALMMATNMNLDGPAADELLGKAGLEVSSRADSVTVRQFYEMAEVVQRQGDRFLSLCFPSKQK